jgi:kynurenine formamidase
LLDYKSYADANKIDFKNFSTHAITFEHFTKMLSTYRITPKRGDILFIRMGVISEWNSFTTTQKEEYAQLKVPEHAGVEASLELLEWLWDSGISAVAGDAISWEVFPTPGPVSIHEYLLAGWGCPIGKLFIYS